MCRHHLGLALGSISSQQLGAIYSVLQTKEGGSERFGGLAKVAQPVKAVLGFKPRRGCASVQPVPAVLSLLERPTQPAACGRCPLVLPG